MKTHPRKRRPALAQKKGARPQPGPAAIDLGIADWRVPIHSHIACLWETEKDLAEALGFIEAGLRCSDHCVVIGDRRDIERILGILESRGLDVEDLQDRKRLTVLERAPTAQGTLPRARFLQRIGPPSRRESLGPSPRDPVSRPITASFVPTDL